MYCESQQQLVDIYNNHAEYHKSDLAVLFNSIFKYNPTASIEPIGYHEPYELCEFKSCEGEHVLAKTFYQEKDYPYILYSKQVNGWYAHFHKTRTLVIDDMDLTANAWDDLVKLAVKFPQDFKSPILSLEWNSNRDMYNWVCYGILPKEINVRSNLYYPQTQVVKDGTVVMSSRDTVIKRIKMTLPRVFDDIVLDDYCFIAGGFLRRCSNEALFSMMDYEIYDIDLFIIRGQHNGYKKLNKVINTLTNNGYEIKVQGYSIVANHKSHPTSIQICPVNYVSLMDVIDNFDTSCTAIAWNGSELFASDAYKQYTPDNESYCKFNTMRESRYDKYHREGYNMVFDDDYTLTKRDEMTSGGIKNVMTAFDDILFAINTITDAVDYHGPYFPSGLTDKFHKKDISPDMEKVMRDALRFISESDAFSSVYSEEPGYSTIEYYLNHRHESQEPQWILDQLPSDRMVKIFTTLWPYPIQ